MAETEDGKQTNEEESTELNEPETTDTSDEKAESPEESEKPKIYTSNRVSSNKFKRLLSAYWAKKKLTLPLTVLVLLLIVFAIPVSRYDTLGLFLKEPVTISVVDSKTGTPVSSAQITLAGKTFDTSSSGKSVQKLKLGSSTLAVSKHYYQSASKGVVITLAASHNSFKIELVATGRQVPITVMNKLTSLPLANASIKVLHTEAKTDKAGKAIIVLPIGATTQKGTVSLAGYNTTDITVQVTDQAVSANKFSVTPAGKLYFLSNQSGKIDVVKTNLDGTNRQTVLPGTGNEEPDNTSLLASRDWKYLTLLSKRTATGTPELNLIDTSTDKVTNIDQGTATFSSVGWSNDYFVYTVGRSGYNPWQPNAISLKSFNAQTGKLTTLDNSRATGSSNSDAKYETLFPNNIYLIGDFIVFSKTWYAYPGYINVPGQQNTLTAIKADGTSKKTIATQDAATAYFGTLFPYAPNELIAQISFINSSEPEQYYEFQADGSYQKDTDQSDITAVNEWIQNNSNPTYLQSPSGSQTFWSEQRDGKNTLFIGDKDAGNPKQIASLSEYAPYGWYTDNYLLVSKDSSELYVMSPGGGTQPFKISDYYKPPTSYRGYGGGYGGL